MASLIKISGENYHVNGYSNLRSLVELKLNGKSNFFQIGESIEKLKAKKGANVREIASKDGEHLLTKINHEAEVRKADYFSITVPKVYFLSGGRNFENLYTSVEVQFYDRVSN